MRRFSFFIAILICGYTGGAQSLLKSERYHTHRNSFVNSFDKFTKTKKGRVAFLGGSITQNSGWRDSIMNYLEHKFPDTAFDFIAAGIASMGSTSGAFRFERDVLKNGSVDLLFEEAAVNDNGIGRTNMEQQRAMEGILRHARYSNLYMDIVVMHFVDPAKMKDYRNGKTPEVILNHENIAAHYNVSTINLAKEVTERIDNNEFTWEDDFINLHPSPFGQDVYARSMIQFLENAYANDHISENPLPKAYIQPEKYTQLAYDNGQFISIESVKLKNGWTIDKQWKPKDGKGTRRRYVDIPMLISDTPGSTLKIKFNGHSFGFVVTAGPDAGMIKFRINKGDWQSFNLFTKWSKNLHLPRFHVLTGALKAGKHTIEIKVAHEKDDRSSGNAVRIKSFFANQK